MAHRICSEGKAMRAGRGSVRYSRLAAYRRVRAATLWLPSAGPLSTGCSGVKPYCSHSARCFSACASGSGRNTSGPARYSLGLRCTAMLLLADVLMPDVRMGRNVFCQELYAIWVAEIVDFHPMFT